ncbi:MAG: ABC transporter ATP-binding protein, partial [Actinomycetaceae bacterium]|nr:ABC transporter ATP-binding protein [Actinomycetaceae bacterium]
MNRKEVVVANQLTRIYGKKFTAVDSIDLSIVEGEIFGLLGTNGAGKTSTLEVLEGLVPATKGTVRVFGLDPRKNRRKIRPFQGVMMQEGGFPTDLTVKETVKMWAGTLSNPLPIEEVINKVGLGHKTRTRVKALSGGEVRRLDLACAILGNPKLLFLDEPTTGLDPESRRNTWSLIRELHQSGTTIVLTTHYLEEAETLCERLAIMHRGQIARAGTPEAVVAGYPGTITFRTDTPLPAAFAQYSTSGDGFVTTQTRELQKDLTELLDWARDANVQLHDL